MDIICMLMLFYVFIENNTQNILFYAAIVGLLRAQIFMINLLEIMFDLDSFGPGLKRGGILATTGIDHYARSASFFYTMLITIFFLINMN